MFSDLCLTIDVCLKITTNSHSHVFFQVCLGEGTFKPEVVIQSTSNTQH